jgi:hypothetical protein
MDSTISEDFLTRLSEATAALSPDQRLVYLWECLTAHNMAMEKAHAVTAKHILKKLVKDKTGIVIYNMFIRRPDENAQTKCVAGCDMHWEPDSIVDSGLLQKYPLFTSAEVWTVNFLYQPLKLVLTVPLFAASDRNEEDRELITAIWRSLGKSTDFFSMARRYLQFNMEGHLGSRVTFMIEQKDPTVPTVSLRSPSLKPHHLTKLFHPNDSITSSPVKIESFDTCIDTLLYHYRLSSVQCNLPGPHGITADILEYAHPLSRPLTLI